MPATLYLSKTGGGKTTLMRSHVSDLVTSSPDLVFLIVDHGEVAGKPAWKDLPCGKRIFRSVGEWWHMPSRVALFQGVSGDEVAQLAIDCGWSVYVDDEADGVVGEGKWKENPLREIVKRGRHIANRAGEITEVHAMLATHRPANLPTDVGGTFDRVYVGPMVAYNEADRVRREGWVNGRNVAETLATLQGLQPGEFLSWP